MRFLTLISALCLALAFAACGGGDSADTTATESILDESLPKIESPGGRPPKDLVVKDLVVGTGRPIKDRDDVAIRYAGAGYKPGKSLGARSAPFYFQVGLGRVMPGFDKGVIGMRLGGRRELIIPPDLTERELGPRETLIYVIDLLGFESGAEYEERLRTGEPAAFP